MEYKGTFLYGLRQVVPLTSTITPQITISSDEDFELHEIRGNVQAQGAIFITIQNSNGYIWSNFAFDAAMISAGATANNKIVLPYPIVIKANTQINITLQNTTGAAITYELQFWGVKC